jgi:hypothetical protein
MLVFSNGRTNIYAGFTWILRWFEVIEAVGELTLLK